MFGYLKNLFDTFILKNGETHEFRSTACYDTRDLLARLSQATSPADIQGALASVPMPGKQLVAALPRAAVGTRVIIRPGEDGGVITQSEYLIAELASKEKLTKRCTNNIIAMLRRKDFIPDEIRTDRIQQIESWFRKPMVVGHLYLTCGWRETVNRSSSYTCESLCQ